MNSRSRPSQRLSAEFAAALALADLAPAGLTFVNLGSGRGRAVMFVAEHPFRRIMGVEFAGVLHAAAVANIAARAALAPWRRDRRPMRVLYMNAIHLQSFIGADWRLLRHERGAALLMPDEAR